MPARLFRAGFFLLVLGLSAHPSPVWPQAAAPENTGPNKNLASHSAGSFRSGGVYEDWQSLAHPDGSTTLLVWRADVRRGTHSDAIYRISADNQIAAAFVPEHSRTGAARSEFARDRTVDFADGRAQVIRLPSKPLGALGVRNLKRAGIARWARGRYAYTTLKDRRARGSEDFHLTVRSDGSRSLSMWHDIFARHSQFSVNLQLDAAQRPTEAFVSYWTVNGYKGSTHIKVDGSQLLADYRGQSGDLKKTLEVPAQFSIGSHPVAGDGWHTFDCQGNTRVYSMEATADLSKPMFGQLTDLPCETLGAERVTVPAGTFDTLHYRIGGVSDVWVTAQDRMMVKFITEKFDRAYTLVVYYGEGFTQSQLRK